MVSAIYQGYVIQVNEIQNIQELAKDDFGVVYKGLMSGYTEVAIKELYNQSFTQVAQKEFEQEIAKFQILHHPNIAQLYGYCTFPLRLIMEFLPQNLLDLLYSQQELSWKMRYKLSLEIVLGLKHAHGQNIIHRNLKSNNILLDEMQRAKITNFGLSRERTESLESENLAGNIRWLAPELISSKPNYSKQSDIFALGVIFWEIASRKIPFQEEQD